MTSPQPGRGQTSLYLRPLLRCLLALALLAPAVFLFTQDWRTTSDRRAGAVRERDGVAYLAALTPLTTALTDAQTAAVTGRPLAASVLTQALDGVAAVDRRVGDELGTHQRWSDLRTKVEAVTSQPANPQTATTVYGELTDLLLGLFTAVRDGAQVVHDPDSAVFHLQVVAGDELPNIVVLVGRFADLALVTAAAPASQQPVLAGALGIAKAALLGPLPQLGDNLQSAVDASTSQAEMQTFLEQLNHLRALSNLVVTGNPANPAQGPLNGLDLAKLPAQRADVVASATSLAVAIFGKLDRLLAARIDAADNRRLVDLAALAVAVLLAVVLVGDALAVRGRGRRGHPAPVERDVTARGDGDWAPQGARAPSPPVPVPAGQSAGYRHEAVDGYQQLAWSERSSAR